MKNREQRNLRQRISRKENGNVSTKKYEKTPNGFLMRAYRNMKSRTSGIQKLKYHLYKGKELFDKETFYTWSKNSDTFHTLFQKWQDSGYSRKLTPSVDRVDSSQGYKLENVVWTTHSENSRRGSVHAHELRKIKSYTSSQHS